MGIKTILTEPDKLLRQVSKPVEKVGDLERELMKDMLDTMYTAKGIGLAAIQIGVSKRIIACSCVPFLISPTSEINPSAKLPSV